MSGDVTSMEAQNILGKWRQGIMASQNEQARVQSTWLQRFGSVACYYPSVGFWDMVEDLILGLQPR